MTRIYRTPLQVAEDGTIVNPEPDEVIVDGRRYVLAGREES